VTREKFSKLVLGTNVVFVDKDDYSIINKGRYVRKHRDGGKEILWDDGLSGIFYEEEVRTYEEFGLNFINTA